MSAITPYAEQLRRERKSDELSPVVLTADDLKGLNLGALPTDADGQPLDPLAKPHTELTRLLWGRTLIAQALVGASFKLDIENAKVMVIAAPAVKREVVSWSWSAHELERFSLFSTNSKMNCPTFDLPSGIGQLGGSCPGAAFAQSTVPLALLETEGPGPRYGEVKMTEKLRKGLSYLVGEVQKDWAHLPKDERAAPVINLNSTVCTRCYASGGKYGEAVVQFSEVARMALVQGMLAQGREADLIDLLVRVIEDTLVWDKGDVKRHGIRPIRVHSSGDFYSPKYAEMWLKVGWRLHQNALDAQRAGDKSYAPVVLWAPTRTHVLEAWNSFWKAAKIPPNFVIRPSAYSVGDPAPYIKRPSPTGAKGTAVLFEDDTRSRIKMKNGAEFGDGKKFDFQCGVYALDAGAKTCLGSTAPDGKKGCRACWKRPDLAVNYVVH